MSGKPPQKYNDFLAGLMEGVDSSDSDSDSDTEPQPEAEVPAPKEDSKPVASNIDWGIQEDAPKDIEPVVSNPPVQEIAKEPIQAPVPSQVLEQPKPAPNPLPAKPAERKRAVVNRGRAPVPSSLFGDTSTPTFLPQPIPISPPVPTQDLLPQTQVPKPEPPAAPAEAPVEVPKEELREEPKTEENLQEEKIDKIEEELKEEEEEQFETIQIEKEKSPQKIGKI